MERARNSRPVTQEHSTRSDCLPTTCCRSREAAQENSPARKRWVWVWVFVYVAAPKGRKVEALPPLRGLFCSSNEPRACALGYLLMPLRGVGQQALSPWAPDLTPIRG